MRFSTVSSKTVKKSLYKIDKKEHSFAVLLADCRQSPFMSSRAEAQPESRDLKRWQFVRLRSFDSLGKQGSSHASRASLCSLRMTDFGVCRHMKRSTAKAVLLGDCDVCDQPSVKVGHSAVVVGTVFLPAMMSALAASTSFRTSSGMWVLVGARSTPPLDRSYICTPAV